MRSDFLLVDNGVIKLIFGSSFVLNPFESLNFFLLNLFRTLLNKPCLLSFPNSFVLNFLIIFVNDLYDSSFKFKLSWRYFEDKFFWIKLVVVVWYILE